MPSKETKRKVRVSQAVSAKFSKGVESRMDAGSQAGLISSISKKAASAIDSQISGLLYQVTEKEGVLALAEEALEAAIYPTQDIVNARGYCQSIADAQLKVDQAEADLVAVEESLEYFKQLKADKF